MKLIFRKKSRLEVEPTDDSENVKTNENIDDSENMEKNENIVLKRANASKK